jgi:hypothetical protein
MRLYPATKKVKATYNGLMLPAGQLDLNVTKVVLEYLKWGY